MVQKIKFLPGGNLWDLSMASHIYSCITTLQCKVVIVWWCCIELNYSRIINVELIAAIVSFGISNGVAYSGQ